MAFCQDIVKLGSVGCVPPTLIPIQFGCSEKIVKQFYRHLLHIGTASSKQLPTVQGQQVSDVIQTLLFQYQVPASSFAITRCPRALDARGQRANDAEERSLPRPPYPTDIQHQREFCSGRSPLYSHHLDEFSLTPRSSYNRHSDWFVDGFIVPQGDGHDGVPDETNTSQQ
jgi:hypothetical protein